VVLSSIFLVLTLNEGHPRQYQRIIDLLFHNWVITASAAIVVWFARRGTFGALPPGVRVLSTVVACYFALTSSVTFLTWQPFWDALKPFGIVQSDVQPAAVLGLIWLWGIFFIVLFISALGPAVS
jgi:hypothetical protein